MTELDRMGDVSGVTSGCCYKGGTCTVSRGIYGENGGSCTTGCLGYGGGKRWEPLSGRAGGWETLGMEGADVGRRVSNLSCLTFASREGADVGRRVSI